MLKLDILEAVDNWMFNGVSISSLSIAHSDEADEDNLRDLEILISLL
jgi:hypothetical protein